MGWKKELIISISTAIISIILVNLGAAILQKEKIIAIISILMSFILLYFIYYFDQIRENQKKIKNLEREFGETGEVLKTLKDIVILKKVSKL